jgi:hypothetical protein
MRGRYASGGGPGTSESKTTVGGGSCAKFHWNTTAVGKPCRRREARVYAPKEDNELIARWR